MRPRYPLQNRSEVASGEAWGSLDFGLQRTLPDIDFPPSRPSSSPSSASPYLSLILASSLQPHRHRCCLWFRRPSRSYRRGLLSFPTGPSLCPSFSPGPPPLLPPAPIPSVPSRSSSSRLQRMLARAATDLAPPNEMCQGLAIHCATHARLRTHTHRLSSSLLLLLLLLPALSSPFTGEKRRRERTTVFNRPFHRVYDRAAGIGIADSGAQFRVMEFGRREHENFICARN